MILQNLIYKTKQFWLNKGLYDHGNPIAQSMKLIEEVEEVKKAILYESEQAQKKELGDSLTVIINICEMKGFTLEECLYLAYEKNSKRTGEMIDGTFVKSEDLPKQSTKEEK